MDDLTKAFQELTGLETPVVGVFLWFSIGRTRCLPENDVEDYLCKMNELVIELYRLTLELNGSHRSTPIATKRGWQLWGYFLVFKEIAQLSLKEKSSTSSSWNPTLSLSMCGPLISSHSEWESNKAGLGEADHKHHHTLLPVLIQALPSSEEERWLVVILHRLLCA